MEVEFRLSTTWEARIPRPKTDQSVSDGVSVGTRPLVEPIAFRKCVGWLHPAAGDVGVVLVSTWGYDEFCARSSWRGLGQAFSDAGYPTLRFDLPGTGNAPGPPASPSGLKTWLDAVHAAADRLRRSADLEKLVLVGQGPGAALAVLAAEERGDVHGLGLLAPVVNGRRYLRELKVRSDIIALRNGAPTEQPSSGLRAAGFDLAPGLVRDIADLDLLTRTRAPAAEVWIAAKPGHTGDRSLQPHLASLGARVAATVYSRYDALLSEPTTAVAPRATFAALLSWTRATVPATHRERARLRTNRPTQSTRQQVQEAVRIGHGAGLFGVLTLPRHAKPLGTVLFLSTARDPQIGRGAMVAAWSKALAEVGIASLRLDCAGVGDSPARPGAPAEVIFSDAQILDTAEALDWLSDRGLTEVTLVGRCSGAYLALKTALLDRRVRSIVLINPSRLIWDPRERVEDAVARPLLNDALSLVAPGAVARLATGRVGFRQAGARVAGVLLRLLHALDRTGEASIEAHLRTEVRAQISRLAKLGVQVSLVRGDKDGESLRQLHRFFGRDADSLSAYPHVSLTMLPDTDHNLSTQEARDRMLALLTRWTTSLSRREPRDAAVASRRSGEPRQRA